MYAEIMEVDMSLIPGSTMMRLTALKKNFPM